MKIIGKKFQSIFLMLTMLVGFHAMACDGTDVTVLSTVDNGDGTYTITFDVCFEPGDMLGVTDQLEIQFNGGGATIVNGAYSPTITFSDGTVFNASLNNSTTVQWSVSGFNWVSSAAPDQCHTVFVTTNGLPTGYDANVGPNCMHDENGSPIGSPCTAPSAAWTNPGPLCETAAAINLDTYITGDTGGTWQVDGVGTTSTFDPSAYGNGSYTVTYTVGTGTCTDTQNNTVVITAASDASTSSIRTVCESDAAITLSTLETGDTGGSWTIDGASATQFDPSTLGAGSYTVVYSVGSGACASSSNQTVTVNANGDPSWTNPGSMCASAAAIDLNTTVTGDAGGSWTVDGVASSSTFDPSAIGVGSYLVEYTVGTCPQSQSYTITVTNAADASWTNPGSLCESDAAIDLATYVTGDAGGSWTVDGVAATSNFDPASLGGGIFNVAYSVGTGACASSQSFNITINGLGDPAWTSPGSMCPSDAAIDLNTTVTGDAGGSWTVDGVASGSTFDPSALGVGSYLVEYTVGTCPQSQSYTIVVTNAADASWTSPSPVCSTGGIIDLNTLVTGDAGGTWLIDGVVSSSNFDPVALGQGSYNVEYQLGTGACAASQAYAVVVNTVGDPSWTDPSDVCESESFDLNTLVTGDLGGSWTINGVAGSTFDATALGAGVHTVDYQVGTGSCVDNLTQNVTVVPMPDASWTSPSPVCITGGSIDLNTLVTGDAGGTWTIDGVASSSTFDPAALGQGSYLVNYEVGSGTCTDSQSYTVVVNSTGDPSWTDPSDVCITETIDLNTLITGDTGGSWTINGNPGNTFDASVLGAGVHTVDYQVGTGGCTDNLTQNITVVATPDASWTTASMCENAGVLDLNTLVTGQAGGTWSGTGVTGTDFYPVISGAGTFNITYTVGTASCQSDSSQLVTVYAVPTSSFDVSSICEGETMEANYTGNATALATYDWDFDGLPSYGVSWGVQDLGTPPPGNYNFSLTVTENGCASTTTTQFVDVYELPMFDGQVTDVLCNGDCNGSVAITNTNVNPSGYTYSWSDGSVAPNLVLACRGIYGLTVTSTEGCVNTFTFEIGSPDPLTVDLITQPISCYQANDGVLTANVVGGTGPYTYDWITGETADSISNLAPGSYSVEVVDSNGCEVTDQASLTEPESILDGYEIIHSGTQLIEFENVFTLNDTSSFDQYAWSVNDSVMSSQESMTYTFNASGIYDISITVTEGVCQEFLMDTIHISATLDIYIPSAFSPNGDNINDLFAPKFNFEQLESYEFNIFNRWGELIFQGTDPSQSWDGTVGGTDLAQIDVYVYQIKVKDISGNSVEKMGHVTIIK